ncbi:MAG: ABC transporter permease subunit [Oscillospiraceae bacterium]|nr:ABC transporter permease subunit [Oscillospiraceae bacterium]
MKYIRGRLQKEWQYHLMLLPGIAIVAVFAYYPLYGLVIAFQQYNPAMGFSSPWVGLDNFVYLFGQPNFTRTIWNTFFIALCKITGGILVQVFFALLLNEVRYVGIKRSFQTMVYIPNFMSWVILSGVLIDILASDGLVNIVLGLLGAKPVAFLMDARIFPWVLIVSDIWKSFGFGTVVYLAALTNIDPGLYEAAIVDGAKRFKQTIYITIPMLLPIITLMSVLNLGNVLNAGFEQVYNLYAPLVYSTGDIIDTYVYRLGIEQAQYSVGASVGMFKSVVSGILVVTSYTLADKLAGYRVF